MLRNLARVSSRRCPSILNEVLSLNAQEFENVAVLTVYACILLNEVLSLNAQESDDFGYASEYEQSSMKS